MRLITLEHLRLINGAKPRRNYRQVVVGVVIWLAITLATPLLRALASYTW